MNGRGTILWPERKRWCLSPTGELIKYAVKPV
jgi:hypothetical protein